MHDGNVVARCRGLQEGVQANGVLGCVGLGSVQERGIARAPGARQAGLAEGGGVVEDVRLLDHVFQGFEVAVAAGSLGGVPAKRGLGVGGRRFSGVVRIGGARRFARVAGWFWCGRGAGHCVKRSWR